jgi:hypothetical protein
MLFTNACAPYIKIYEPRCGIKIKSRRRDLNPRPADLFPNDSGPSPKDKECLRCVVTQVSFRAPVSVNAFSKGYKSAALPG